MDRDALGHVPVYIQNISGILRVLVCMKESVGGCSLCVCVYEGTSDRFTCIWVW